jgi:hypothetical protein
VAFGRGRGLGYCVPTKSQRWAPALCDEVQRSCARSTATTGHKLRGVRHPKDFIGFRNLSKADPSIRISRHRLWKLFCDLLGARPDNDAEVLRPHFAKPRRRITLKSYAPGKSPGQCKSSRASNRSSATEQQTATLPSLEARPDKAERIVALATGSIARPM